MKRLAFLLPTNDPAVFDNIFMKSVENLKYISDKILFAINFQKPFTKAMADDRVSQLTKMGFEVRYTFNEYTYERKGLIPFNKIRYDCAVLCPEIELYALCDDDFEFTRDSDLMVQNIIDKFDEDKSIGLIQCSCKPYFFPTGYFKQNVARHNYYTDNGFFFRNIHNQDANVLVYPSTALQCVGACEEYIIGLELVKHGYEVYLRTYSSILHHRQVNQNGDSPYAWGGQEILHSKNGIFTYIENNYKEIFEKEKE